MPEHGMDIIGLGVSTIDEIILLEHHPQPNRKQRVLSRIRQCGGLTGSALVAASRQGVRCGYAISLGTGELSGFLRHRLTEERIVLLENNDTPSAEPYLSLVLNDCSNGERSILWDNTQALPPKITEREKSVILSARCLFVDHVWSETIYPVVQAAREQGIDIVGDYERTFGCSLELMRITNHIILPIGYCRELFGSAIKSKEAVIHLASEAGRSLACVTDGVNGCWFARGDRPTEVFHQPVFPMEQIVDTTGCGDVFHGVYAAGLVAGYSPEERIRRAAAAAALKTQKAGSQAGSPTRAELDSFLQNRQ